MIQQFYQVHENIGPYKLVHKIFTATFLIAKKWKRSKYTTKYGNPYNRLTIERTEIMINVATWMNLENTTLSEQSHKRPHTE